MRAPALGEAATRLSALVPCAASLLAFARGPVATAWERIRFDPAAVLLLLSQAPRGRSLPGLSFFPTLLHEPTVLDAAVRVCDLSSAGFVDWNLGAVQPIYHSSLNYAQTAHRLAQHMDRCDPDNAWAAGLLAPLGWLAISAVNPAEVLACLSDPGLSQNPVLVQQRIWGLDQGAIARRLSRRWHLPPWLTAIAGHLDLPVETAQKLGADPDIFQVVQLAVSLVQCDGKGLHLGVGSTIESLAAALKMTDRILEEASQPASALEMTWKRHDNEPLLRDLLILAADKRRLSEAPLFDDLESTLDHLHRALQEQQTGAEHRLRTLKLGALAELAAGAGHEINNPLAVISGQAQYLLNHESEPAHQRALQTIIGQTQRIHVILTELMQFARPPRPQKTVVDVPSLVQEAAESVRDLAAQRRVQLLCPPPANSVVIYADPRQIRTAMSCLLRNAVEAAPPEGWAGIRLENASADHLALVVEDSGNGPASAQREHLFDPFYSGRQAGRGRGLGLPTAWRLAKEHGGDIHFERPHGGPTRFVLKLPLLLPGSIEGQGSPLDQSTKNGNGSVFLHLETSSIPPPEHGNGHYEPAPSHPISPGSSESESLPLS